MNIRIKHFHDRNRRLIATIATTDIDGGYTAIGIARCHEGDVPNRKLGCTIARERLKKLLAGNMTSHQLIVGEGMVIKSDRMAEFVRSNPFLGNFNNKVAGRFDSPVWLHPDTTPVSKVSLSHFNRTHPILQLGFKA